MSMLRQKPYCLWKCTGVVAERCCATCTSHCIQGRMCSLFNSRADRLTAWTNCKGLSSSTMRKNAARSTRKPSMEALRSR